MIRMDADAEAAPAHAASAEPRAPLPSSPVDQVGDLLDFATDALLDAIAPDAPPAASLPSAAAPGSQRGMSA